MTTKLSVDNYLTKIVYMSLASFGPTPTLACPHFPQHTYGLLPPLIPPPGYECHAMSVSVVDLYRVAQNKMPHRRICNISATNGLILKILEAA